MDCAARRKYEEIGAEPGPWITEPEILMNPHSEKLLTEVYPPLADKVRQLAASLDFSIIVSQGLRTWEYQHYLWLKGRNADGSYIDPIHHKGVVTNADAGHSWHNFGLAVDCDVLNKDGTVDWNSSHPAWGTMEKSGMTLGLISGVNWGGEPVVRFVDAPHFQINGRFPVNAPDDEVRALYASGGLSSVWAALDSVVIKKEITNELV